jgi:hypothetical protein
MPMFHNLRRTHDKDAIHHLLFPVPALGWGGRAMPLHWALDPKGPNPKYVSRRYSAVWPIGKARSPAEARTWFANLLPSIKLPRPRLRVSPFAPSAERLLKNYLRPVMSQERLNGLATLCIEKKFIRWNWYWCHHQWLRISKCQNKILR